MFFCDTLCGAPVQKIVKATLPELNLHDESLVMLSGALTIYLVADLRALAKKGKATVDIEALQPPISVTKVLELIKENKTALIESGEYDDELEGRLAALDNLHLHSNGFLGKIIGNKTKLIEFVDNNANEELVHAITVNDVTQRITVIFRGSVTKTDFITDAKVAQLQVDNPAHALDPDNPSINLHFGFHEYLFKKKCPNDNSKTRIQSIMDNVHSLLEDNPGYTLSCTGHSLGAALCTLFGFYMAANEKTGTLLAEPVRVVSVASPYVGGPNFLLAFQALERKGKLMHLRIANAEDVVTLMPVVGPKIGIVSPIMAMKGGVANVYKHCGMKLQLKKKPFEHGKIFTISYPMDHSTDESYAKEITNLLEDGKNFAKSIGKVFKKEAHTVAGYHSCEEYERRLNIIKGDIDQLTLTGLYSDKTIVGSVLDEGYKPVVMKTNKEHFDRITGSKIIKEAIRGN